ncbi:hypothetical protein ACFQ2B_26095 [Streptomyces stramineus]
MSGVEGRIKDVIDAVNLLARKSLRAVRNEFRGGKTSLYDAVDAVYGLIGSVKTPGSVNGRIANLNGRTLGSIIGQVKQLRDALRDAAKAAGDLDDGIGDVNRDTGGGPGGGDSGGGKEARRSGSSPEAASFPDTRPGRTPYRQSSPRVRPFSDRKSFITWAPVVSTHGTKPLSAAGSPDSRAVASPHAVARSDSSSMTSTRSTWVRSSRSSARRFRSTPPRRRWAVRLGGTSSTGVRRRVAPPVAQGRHGASGEPWISPLRSSLGCCAGCPRAQAS